MTNETPSQRVDVHRLSMKGPGDVSALTRLLDDKTVDARDIVAILGKTEGNGGVNDFTREYASRCFAQALAAHLGCSEEEAAARVPLVMSGGTEGVLSPHATVFVRSRASGPGSGPARKRLAVGVAFTRAFLPEEVGRQAQIDETAAAVRRAMADAGIADTADVHFVQIKCPLLTADRIAAAQSRHCATVTGDAYESMAYSRGASALGTALALGEIPGPLDEAVLLAELGLYSGVASASAGIELDHSAVILMGNSASAGGHCVIGHAVMQDAIDLDGVLQAFASVGLDASGRPGSLDGERTELINVLAKAESSPDGLIRGLRHIMLDDTDITPTRHARAAVGGLIAGVARTTAIYVSGGAEHQGPAGGGPVAVIARVMRDGPPA